LNTRFKYRYPSLFLKQIVNACGSPQLAQPYNRERLRFAISSPLHGSLPDCAFSNAIHRRIAHRKSKSEQQIADMDE